MFDPHFRQRYRERGFTFTEVTRIYELGRWFHLPNGRWAIDFDGTTLIVQFEDETVVFKTIFATGSEFSEAA